MEEEKVEAFASTAEIIQRELIAINVRTDIIVRTANLWTHLMFAIVANVTLHFLLETVRTKLVNANVKKNIYPLVVINVIMDTMITLNAEHATAF